MDLNCGDFPGSPSLKTVLLLQGARVPVLVRELRSCMLCGKNKNKNCESCSTTVFTTEKKSTNSEPQQFKPVLFKGQLYITSHMTDLLHGLIYSLTSL